MEEWEAYTPVRLLALRSACKIAYTTHVSETLPAVVNEFLAQASEKVKGSSILPKKKETQVRARLTSGRTRGHGGSFPGKFDSYGRHHDSCEGAKAQEVSAEDVYCLAPSRNIHRHPPAGYTRFINIL